MDEMTCGKGPSHDESALGNARALQIFELLVRREQELVALLQQRLALHEPMLQMMKRQV